MEGGEEEEKEVFFVRWRGQLRRVMARNGSSIPKAIDTFTTKSPMPLGHSTIRPAGDVPRDPRYGLAYKGDGHEEGGIHGTADDGGAEGSDPPRAGVAEAVEDGHVEKLRGKVSAAAGNSSAAFINGSIDSMHGRKSCGEKKRRAATCAVRYAVPDAMAMRSPLRSRERGTPAQKLGRGGDGVRTGYCRRRSGG
eukprot:3271718-Rhodomonas_salina.1